MKAETVRQVTCGAQKIEYTLIRKRVKNINLRVRSDGTVRVSAGVRVNTDRIDQFVAGNGAMIMAAKERFRQIDADHEAPLTYKTGEKVQYLGRELTLVVRSNDSISQRPAFLAESAADRLLYSPSRISLYQAASEDQVCLANTAVIRGNQLLLFVRDPANPKQREKIFLTWQAEQCWQIFGRLMEEVQALFAPLGVTWNPALRIRTMKSRWGSCMPQRRIITLNKHLLAFEEKFIIYVIIHEFAHFIYPDHSLRFHRLVGSFLPNWKELRRELNRRGKYLL